MFILRAPYVLYNDIVPVMLFLNRMFTIERWYKVPSGHGRGYLKCETLPLVGTPLFPNSPIDSKLYGAKVNKASSSSAKGLQYGAPAFVLRTAEHWKCEGDQWHSPSELSIRQLR